MRKRGTMNNDLKTEEMCENWLIQQKQKLKRVRMQITVI